MKNKILLCSICALFFFSCKKEKKTTPSEKLYPITFNLTGFTQTQIPIGKAKPASLATQAVDPIPVAQLNYILYDETGANIISANHRHTGDTDFGTFTDQVAPGKYNAVFYGGSDLLQMGHLLYTIYDVIAYNNQPGASNILSPWDDTFYKKVPLTVGNSGAINQTVALDRITARLDIVIKDAIPAGATKFYVSFKDTCAVKLFDGQGIYTGDGGLQTNVTTRTLSTADIGKLNYTITMYTLNNAPFDLTIKYFGSSATDPILIKTIKNVVCKRNYRTILSGTLFDQGNTSFNITVDPVWNTPVNGNF